MSGDLHALLLLVEARLDVVRLDVVCPAFNQRAEASALIRRDSFNRAKPRGLHDSAAQANHAERVELSMRRERTPEPGKLLVRVNQSVTIARQQAERMINTPASVNKPTGHIGGTGESDGGRKVDSCPGKGGGQAV
jgi:hypothetical protein